MPLEFSLIIEAEGQSQTDVEGAALAIKEYLSEIGIKVNIKHMDSQSINSIVFKNKKFDMIISSWVFDQLNDVSSLFQSKGANNYISYKNKKVDKYLDVISRVDDKEKIRLANFALHKILQVDCPYAFLWTLDKYAAIHKKIGGSDDIHPFKFFTFIRNWYIPKDYQ